MFHHLFIERLCFLSNPFICRLFSYGSFGWVAADVVKSGRITKAAIVYVDCLKGSLSLFTHQVVYVQLTATKVEEGGCGREGNQRLKYTLEEKVKRESKIDSEFYHLREYISISFVVDVHHLNMRLFDYFVSTWILLRSYVMMRKWVYWVIKLKDLVKEMKDS